MMLESKVLDFNFDDGTISYESNETKRKRNEILVASAIVIKYITPDLSE